ELVAIRDGSASLWDLLTGKVRQTVDSKGLQVLAASVSPSGQHVAVSGLRVGKEPIAQVVLWDAKTGVSKRMVTEQGCFLSADALAFSPDGKWLAVSVVQHGYRDDNYMPKPGGKASGELRLLPVR